MLHVKLLLVCHKLAAVELFCHHQASVLHMFRCLALLQLFCMHEMSSMFELRLRLQRWKSRRQREHILLKQPLMLVSRMIFHQSRSDCLHILLTNLAWAGSSSCTSKHDTGANAYILRSLLYGIDEDVASNLSESFCRNLSVGNVPPI